MQNLRTKVVQSMFAKEMGVTIRTTERIHRIGRIQQGKTRPVIIKLVDYHEKTELLKNAFQLKDTDVSISEDFSAATCQKKEKSLGPHEETPRAR